MLPMSAKAARLIARRRITVDKFPPSVRVPRDTAQNVVAVTFNLREAEV
jgi:hypothetical protein